MADSPPYSDSPGQAGAGGSPDRSAVTGPPRWVKLFALVAILAVALVGVLLLTGGGHGPGRHTGSGDADGQAAPSGVTESSGGASGHTPPAGGHAP